MNLGLFSGILSIGARHREDPLNKPARSSKPLYDTRLAQRVLIGFCLILLGAIPAGCIFSPHQDKVPPEKTQPYPDLVNPTSVLDALSQAYGKEDSVEIKAIYDINYQGTSFDPATLSPLTFTRQDEIRHIQALYRTTSITSVALTFPNERTRYTDSSDPPGWATMLIQDMAIQINDSPDSYNLLPQEKWEFKFIPTVDTASPTDTTWKIVRWTELP